MRVIDRLCIRQEIKKNFRYIIILNEYLPRIPEIFKHYHALIE